MQISLFDGYNDTLVKQSPPLPKSKVCNTCNKEKPIENFFYDWKRKKDGSKHYKNSAKCEQCYKEHKNKYDRKRSRTRDRRDYYKEWCKNNSRKEYHKKWQKEAKEKEPACAKLLKIKYCKCGKILGISNNRNKRFCPICLDKRRRKQYLIQKRKLTREVRNEINRKARIKDLQKRIKSEEYNTCKVCDKTYYYSFLLEGSTKYHCSIKCRKVSLNSVARVQRHRRRARKQNVKIAKCISFNKLFSNQHGECKVCGVKMNKEHKNRDTDAELDHIIPLSKGGYHWTANLQLLCRACNHKKNDSIWRLELPPGNTNL